MNICHYLKMKKNKKGNHILKLENWILNYKKSSIKLRAKNMKMIRYMRAV